MLTSEGEADEKLREMNETFLASLEGLGGIEESIRRKKTDSPESPGRESPTRLGMEGLVRPRYGSAASQGSGEVTGCLMMFAEGAISIYSLGSCWTCVLLYIFLFMLSFTIIYNFFSY